VSSLLLDVITKGKSLLPKERSLLEERKMVEEMSLTEERKGRVQRRMVTEESAEGDFPIMMALINSVPPEYVVRDMTSSLHHPSRPTTRISTEI